MRHFLLLESCSIESITMAILQSEIINTNTVNPISQWVTQIPARLLVLSNVHLQLWIDHLAEQCVTNGFKFCGVYAHISGPDLVCA